MKKVLISLLLTMTSIASGYAQTTVADVFKIMPDTLLPYISQNNRLDLLDFIESGMKARITNAFDNETTLDTLSNDYLRLTLSPSSVMEMNLIRSAEALPDSSEYKIKTTLTLGEKYKVRVVKTYTEKWLPLR